MSVSWVHVSRACEVCELSVHVPVCVSWVCACVRVRACELGVHVFLCMCELCAPVSVCACVSTAAAGLGSSSLPTRGNPAGSGSPGAPPAGRPLLLLLLELGTPRGAAPTPQRAAAPVPGCPCPGVPLSPGYPLCHVPWGQDGSQARSLPPEGQHQEPCKPGLPAAGAASTQPLRARPSSFPFKVGQVFLYFQWDSLLLEAGFLGVLVAPLRLFKWRSTVWRAHDGVTFWLVRWLLFRLMFASGVVKLTSRCPTWWGLTALTYHYETQCIPTPAAWFAHQLPVWFQKLSVVATYVIEIAVPLLFFAPIRRLRLFAFYCQVLLQVLIILTGNYNFFNALTIVLAFSLLDEEHVAYWLGRSKKKHGSSWPPSFLAFLSTLLELAAYALLLYWSVQHFGLEIDWEKKVLESKVAFTYHEFTQWLRAVTLPLVGLGFLSLSWEILSALYRCVCVRGCFWKLWALLQWAVFATAAVGVFAVSLVPFTYIDYESNGKLWPGIHHMFNAVERFQVVNSYGLFRRMTGVGGRPEVVLEGSYDKQTWTEIEFMYKPGNVSAAPPLVAPHQPRLDWQMWFAALGHHSSSPWFASFVHRLLQGKKDVIRLVQLDEAKYPFSAQPPTYIRAQLYKYWFTGSAETGEGATRWWRRQHVQEFFPTVSLGDPTLENLLAQHGLKDKAPPKRPATTFLPWLLESIRRLSLPYSGPAVLWSLYLVAASACLLRALGRRPRGGAPPARHKGPKRGDPVDRGGDEKNGQVRRKEAKEAEEKGEGRARGVADSEGPRSTKKKK